LRQPTAFYARRLRAMQWSELRASCYFASTARAETR